MTEDINISEAENIEDSEEEEDDIPSYDLGMLGKALIIFGMILMISYIILYFTAFIGSFEGTWEGSIVGNVNAFACALPLSIILLIAGFALYLLDSGFTGSDEDDDLDEFGEYEVPIDEDSEETTDK